MNKSTGFVFPTWKHGEKMTTGHTGRLNVAASEKKFVYLLGACSMSYSMQVS